MRAAMLAAAMACVLVTGAQAAAYTERLAFSGSLGEFGRDFRLPAFDATRGTLTSAEAAISGFVIADLSLQLNTPAPPQVTITPAVKVDSPGVGLLNFDLPNQVVPGGSRLTSGPVPFNVATAIALGNATAFDGVFLTLTALTRIPSGQGLSGTILTDATSVQNGQIAVTFTYDVPEPASMALLAVGLLGVAAQRRREHYGVPQ